MNINEIDLNEYEVLEVKGNRDVVLRLKNEFRDIPDRLNWIRPGVCVNTGIKRDFHGDIYGHVVSLPKFSSIYSGNWCVVVEFQGWDSDIKKIELNVNQLKKAKAISSVKYVDDN